MAAAVLMVIVVVTAVVDHDLRRGGRVATDMAGDASREPATPSPRPVPEVREPVVVADEDRDRRPGADAVEPSSTGDSADSVRVSHAPEPSKAPRPSPTVSVPSPPTERAPVVVTVGESRQPRFPVHVSLDEESRPTARVDLPRPNVRPDDSGRPMWKLLETMVERYVEQHGPRHDGGDADDGHGRWRDNDRPGREW